MTAGANGVYVHHIPEETNDPDAYWQALCGVPMPADHLAVCRRGPVVVCETCALVFRAVRVMRRAPRR